MAVVAIQATPPTSIQGRGPRVPLAIDMPCMPSSHDILRAQPFGLSDEDIAWVDAQRAQLSGAQRLAQLFNVMLLPHDAQHLALLRRLQPGAITQFS